MTFTQVDHITKALENIKAVQGYRSHSNFDEIMGILEHNGVGNTIISLFPYIFKPDTVFIALSG